MPKEWLPRLLNRVIAIMAPAVKQNIISGFRKCGIVPFNRDAVLSHVTHTPTVTQQAAIRDCVSDVLVTHLSGTVASSSGTQRAVRKRRLNVTPGKSVSLADLGTSKDESESGEDDSSEENATTDEDEEMADEDEEATDEDEKAGVEESAVPLTVGTYVVVKFQTIFQPIYHYVGKIQFVVDQHTYQIHFLRRRDDNFVFPDAVDEMVIDNSDIAQVLHLANVGRGKHTFNKKINVENLH